MHLEPIPQATPIASQQPLVSDRPSARSTTPPLRSAAPGAPDEKPFDPAHVYAAANGTALFSGRDVLAAIGSYSAQDLAAAEQKLQGEQAAYQKLGRISRYFSDEPALSPDAGWVHRHRLWEALPYDFAGAKTRKRDPISRALDDLLRARLIEVRSAPDYDYEQGRVVLAGYHDEYRLSGLGKSILGSLDADATIDSLKRRRAHVQPQLG